MDSEKETFTFAVLQLRQILRHLPQALSVSLAILISDVSSQDSIGLQRSMLASTPHLAHSEQLPASRWVSPILCSEIPAYPTGHQGNNWGDKSRKALHDCYRAIHNFFSCSHQLHIQLGTFFFPSRKKEGRSIRDQQ